MIFRQPPYSWLLLVAIAASLFTWTRLARRDHRLVLIYVAALLSAFIGAKLVYVLAEGWLDWPLPDRWLRLATGKSVLGALLGGYAGVELAKHALGHRAATGDLFALVAPLGIAIGRVGCLLHGCCTGIVCKPAWWTLRDTHGIARWPAVPVEIAFNVIALAVFLILRNGWFSVLSSKLRVAPPGAEPETRDLKPGTILAGQHFHLYLIGYGAFRFVHEFMRATPRVVLGLSGYQFAAFAVALLGVAGFARRGGFFPSACVRQPHPPSIEAR